MRAVQLPGGRLPISNPPQAVPVQSATNPAAGPGSVQPTNVPTAKIQFESLVHDFGKVKAGDPVKLTFWFTNVGTQVLEVTGVQPQCGCTVAGEWTKKVDPGKPGIIPVQFNTANYHGQVFKTITVTCNDAAQSHVLLQLRGNIWKPIDFTPPYTVMNILPEMTNATATVKIVNNMEQPLDIMSPECSIQGFAVELQTNQPGKEFQLTIRTVPPLKPGTMSGKVVVKTSATNAPTLDIPFWANVQPAVMVLPPQVMIPSGPLTAKATPAVTIQNNSTNALKVTDPVVSVPGVQAEVKELQPGRIFSVQLSFPEGFEMKPGDQASLIFKTSHPRFAEVKVPILQMARPTNPPNASPAASQPGRPQLQSSATKVQVGGGQSPVAAPH